jgi:2-keto-3-deoxy-L-fuconate dehydrogenase
MWEFAHCRVKTSGGTRRCAVFAASVFKPGDQSAKEDSMAGRLQGKRALITAAAQGIGRASAEAFAREGAEVIATDINMEKLAELKGTAGITPLRLDVLDAAAVAVLPRQTGAVDILFNVAGFVHAGTILDATEGEWSFAFDLNVRSIFRLIKAYLPGMLQVGGGSIINVSSVVGFAGVPNRFIYSATKAAIIGITKSVAADFITKGVRCNAICPGTVQSPSLEERLHATGNYEAARKAFVERQKMGRLGKPEEIAALAVYLASDEAAFTTGRAHIVDGGMTM